MTINPFLPTAHLAVDQLADDLLASEQTWIGPDGHLRWAMTPAQLDIEAQLVPNEDERAVADRGPWAVVEATSVDQACYRASVLLASTRHPLLVADALANWRVEQQRRGITLPDDRGRHLRIVCTDQ